MDSHATIEELLEVMSSVRFVQILLIYLKHKETGFCFCVQVYLLSGERADLVQMSRVHLKTETEYNLRNVVLGS
jgi:hypothetical protein